MSTNAIKNAHDSHHDHELEVRDRDLYGFWIYLMTDCVLFGSLFICFLVLGAGYPAYKFDLNMVMGETIMLLTSSFTMGLAVLSMHKKKAMPVYFWLIITVLLGAGFLVIELKEFAHLIAEGKGYTTHAYFSAFFALVGTHGVHVFFGILYMLALVAQIMIHGITPRTTTKLLLLSLFWHFLDIVWVIVFSVVYLIGGL